MIVQEDKAPSHASKHQIPVFSIHEIERLLWPGNSPDLDMIEPCWFWMKRRTTSKGPPTSRLIAEPLWNKIWDDLPQQKIQEWIERIPRHISKVIELKGGDEYCEGRLDVDGRTKEEKILLAKMREEMLIKQAVSSTIAPVSTSSSIASLSRPSSQASNETFNPFPWTRAYITPEPSTPEPLTPPSMRRNILLSSVKSPSFRIQKVARTAASFRPKRKINGRFRGVFVEFQFWYQKTLITR